MPISDTHQPHTSYFSSTFPNAEGFKKRNKDVISKLYIIPTLDKYREPWHLKGHGSILPAGNVSTYVEVQATITTPIAPRGTSLITTVKENSVLHEHQNRKRFKAGEHKLEPTKYSVMPEVLCRR